MAAAERLAASGAADAVQVSAACWNDGPYRQVTLFGTGVGIWNTAAQFWLPPAGLETVLQQFRDADFGAMPTVFGGNVVRVAAHSAPTIICQVSLRAASVSKEVVQRDRGTQSTSLWRLANGILDLSEQAAATSERASSLDDGLDKLVANQLAPETLHLTLNHRASRAPGREPGSWILRVDGREALAEADGPDGTRQVSGLRLTGDDFSSLLRALQAARVAALPGNVYFPAYADLNVGVLDREHQVQARRFAGMSPDRKAQGRTEFAELVASLSALHQRVLANGHAVP